MSHIRKKVDKTISSASPSYPNSYPLIVFIYLPPLPPYHAVLLIKYFRCHLSVIRISPATKPQAAHRNRLKPPTSASEICKLLYTQIQFEHIYCGAQNEISTEKQTKINKHKDRVKIVSEMQGKCFIHGTNESENGKHIACEMKKFLHTSRNR